MDMLGSLKDIRNKYCRTSVQVRAAFWFQIGTFLQKGMSTITTPIFTRLMSTEEYGKYNVFYSWLGILSVFVTVNIAQSTYVQGLVKYEQERKVFVSSYQGLLLVLSAGWTIIYLLSYRFWNDLLGFSTLQMLCMQVSIWTGSVFGLWAAEKRVDYKYRELIGIIVLMAIGQPILGLTLVYYAKDKVTARIISLALAESLFYGWLFIPQIKEGKVFFSKKYWKYALLVNIPLIPHYLSSHILSNADRIMIASMVGDSAAGVYALAYSIAQVLTIFSLTLVQTISPWFYRAIKNEKFSKMPKFAYILLTGVAFANLLLIFFSPEIVAIFAPEAYYSAIWVIPPVAMSSVFIFAYNLFAFFEFYFEETKWISMATFVTAILNIILNYVFIQIFGYIAAGYTTLICYVLYALFHYYNMKKICRIHLKGITVYNPKRLLFIIWGFILMSVGMMMLYYAKWIRYGLLGVISLIILIKRKDLVKAVRKVFLYINGMRE